MGGWGGPPGLPAAAPESPSRAGMPFRLLEEEAKVHAEDEMARRQQREAEVWGAKRKSLLPRKGGIAKRWDAPLADARVVCARDSARPARSRARDPPPPAGARAPRTAPLEPARAAAQRRRCH